VGLVAGAFLLRALAVLRNLRFQPRVGVLKRHRHFSHPSRGRVGRTGKDQVFGLFHAQVGERVFAHHPADRVSHVGLAAAVGTDDRRNAEVEDEFSLLAKVLKPWRARCLNSMRLRLEV